jgi:heme exporter protein C
MTPAMLQTMLFSIAVFSVVFVAMFWHRIRLGQFAEKVEQLKLKVTQ